MKMVEHLELAFGGGYDRIADVPSLAAANDLSLSVRLLASPKDAFAALRDDPTLAGGEMSVSFYMTERSRLRSESEFVALPVWISRAFRHGNIFVREDSDVTSPADLRGRTVGLPEYGMTMAVWLRGLFADEYGVQPADMRWVSHRAPAGLTDGAVIYPSDVTITAASEGTSWDQQLVSGEVDAWIGAGAAPTPKGVRRLFADPPREEREYFGRTGIFPVMHVLVLRQSLVNEDPELAQKVFNVFDEAKARAQRRLLSTSVSYATLPWTLAAAEEQIKSMGGGDPWPYGLDSNQRTLDSLVRFMDQQGLVWDKLGLTDYFLPLERS